MSPLDEARALVGGDGPTAERVAAVVAERDELRHRWHRDLAKARAADARIREIAGVLSPAVETAAAVRLLVEDRDACASERDDLCARLAAYESATVEAPAETLAALRKVDAVADHEVATVLYGDEAAAIRDHLRWLTTRYQREHVGRERAEMQRDVARTERDVIELHLEEARSQCDLAMTWGRIVAEGAAWAAMGRRAERLTEQLMRDEIAASWRAERDAALERGVRLGLSAARQRSQSMRFDGYCVGDEAVRHLGALDPAAIIAAAREREPATQETAGEDGAALIASERRRQVAEESWSPEHDDQHQLGQLAIVAAALAVRHTDAHVEDPHEYVDAVGLDCWGLVKKHGRDQARALAIAGALIAAEIDRLARGRVRRAAEQPRAELGETDAGEGE